MALRTFLRLTALGLAAMASACASSPARTGPGCAGASCATGFVVLAADRGFLGNEEVRDAFQAAGAGVNAELLFVTDERTEATLARALAALRARGARQFVAVPLFVSAHHPRLELAQRLLQQATAPDPLRLARPFGESYFAVEILADALRPLPRAQRRELVVVGEGARDAASRQAMQADLQRIAERAADGFGFGTVRAVVLDERQPDTPATTTTAPLETTGDATLVLPFALGRRLDSMMSLGTSLKAAAPADATVLDGDVTPHADVATWLRREFHRHLPRQPQDAGVVFLAHGSDYHWNDTMREAVRALDARYKIEFAFSMADPPTVERAIRRLEARGARAIVVVRVFGLAASFRHDVERMLGLDIEGADRALPARPAHDHAHAHATAPERGQASAHAAHGHGPAADTPPPRIRTAAWLTTVGGLEAHPLFAQALLARAREQSQLPSRETIVLVAHGAGPDEQNAHWLRLLQDIAGQMRAQGGAAFRGIEIGTWREDWPAQRETHLRDIRSKVAAAAANGGRAIVVPARTLGVGSERQFLNGLDFALGSGFAPHPLFARWFEEQIVAGLGQLDAGPATRDAREQGRLAQGLPAVVPALP